jgi:hypothetical protein
LPMSTGLRSWLLPIALAVVAFALIAGCTELSLMADTLRSKDGINWHSPTTEERAKVLVSTILGSLTFAPIVTIPSVVAARLTLNRRGNGPWLAALGKAALVGGIVGGLLSMLIYVAVGGWGPPQLPAFVAAGIAAAAGWGLVLEPSESGVVP